MVWKIAVNEEKNGWAIVNIRKLNDLVISDTYPLPLQSKIIANVQKYTNLAILDDVSFFYQWLLLPNYQYMFIIVTYKGQKMFQVLIMDYINLVAYVQHKIDNIL